MSPSKKLSEDLTYEEAFAELESVVEALEGKGGVTPPQQIPLNEAIGLYERGQALTKYCAGLLEKAELKVRQLSGDQLIDFESGE